ncbi:hypothetical protein EV652_104447 [Kribbella steppae]|uniref:Uncharacterized protein n=1 Tax=Kribbella steppae TaxID=2512223 RepID=A0A4R2HNP5_9ACTN|nr:hypothetical protein [Kribbella steppae]TCO32841.1 hypothetical protein EV652_104447 [Kribbella steppae]
MTTPDDRPFSDDDRRMTATDRDALDADRDALDPDRRAADYRDTDRTTDLPEADRTTDLPDADRTTDADEGYRTADYRDTDRTTDLADADGTTDAGEGDPTRREGDLREPGTDWSAGPSTGATAGATTDDRSTATEPLVAEDDAVDFRTRWEVIQQGFVDDPRNSVSEADKLVDDLLKRLSMSFEQQHQGLEKQWSDGEPSTEDLRAALQKYRAFFQRLLAL